MESRSERYSVVPGLAFPCETCGHKDPRPEWADVPCELVEGRIVRDSKYAKEALEVPHPVLMLREVRGKLVQMCNAHWSPKNK
jgi:hypothetical protein